MSERLRQSPEAKIEQLNVSAETERNLKRINREALERASEKAEVNELQGIVEQRAVSAEDITVGDKEQVKQYHDYSSHKELKSQAYKRSLRHIQSKLTMPEKVFSKVAHQPIIDKVSNGASKTVARPSGILGGGIVAFIGSCLLLYISRQYGFSYNYFVFFLLLMAGFFLGTVAELAIRSIAKVRR